MNEKETPWVLYTGINELEVVDRFTNTGLQMSRINCLCIIERWTEETGHVQGDMTIELIF